MEESHSKKAFSVKNIYVPSAFFYTSAGAQKEAMHFSPFKVSLLWRRFFQTNLFEGRIYLGGHPPVRVKIDDVWSENPTEKEGGSNSKCTKHSLWSAFSVFFGI